MWGGVQQGEPPPVVSLLLFSFCGKCGEVLSKASLHQLNDCCCCSVSVVSVGRCSARRASTSSTWIWRRRTAAPVLSRRPGGNPFIYLIFYSVTDPDPVSQIPDLGSRIQDPTTPLKEDGGQIFWVPPFF